MILYLNVEVGNDRKYNNVLPASSVHMLTNLVYGPIPALFSAARTIVYIVNGISLAVILFVFENS